VKLTFVEKEDQKVFHAFPDDADEESLLMSGGFYWCPGKELRGHAPCTACFVETSGYFTSEEQKAVQFVRYADEQARVALSVNPDLKPFVEWYDKNPPPKGWYLRIPRPWSVLENPKRDD
jgi:hypothetical protein